jgi:predicted lipoprotein with Yx(FWY)xxD motif
MRRTPTGRLAALATAGLLAGTLAACADDDGGAGGANPDVDLSAVDSDLGEIVVDSAGMTVYYFANDEPGSGESACTDDCLAAWPPVHADSEDVEVDGVTAEVGTITGNDGELQVTLDGRPLYLYVEDAEPGDVTGQGVNDVWWVVAPDGAEVTKAPDVGGGY